MTIRRGLRQTEPDLAGFDELGHRRGLGRRSQAATGSAAQRRNALLERCVELVEKRLGAVRRALAAEPLERFADIVDLDQAQRCAKDILA